MSFHVPEKYRVKIGDMASDESYGNNGAFMIMRPASKGKLPIQLVCIASDGMEWEHISVSTRHRCPTWDEMCFIKSLFWDGEDCVMQLHPPESEYVNFHPYCLHLWHPIGIEIPTPPSIMV